MVAASFGHRAVAPKLTTGPMAWPGDGGACCRVCAPTYVACRDGGRGRHGWQWFHRWCAGEQGIPRAFHLLCADTHLMGVPAAVLGALTLKIISASASKGDGEPPPLPPGLAKALGVPTPGEPKEFLKIEKLNSKLDSYEYSFRKASLSKASALRARARSELEKKLGAEFAAFGLDARTLDKVIQAASLPPRRAAADKADRARSSRSAHPASPSRPISRQTWR